MIVRHLADKFVETESDGKVIDKTQLLQCRKR